MIIDCDRCELRDIACDDCVMSVLLQTPAEDIDADTASALRLLGERGLTPPLRLTLPPAVAG